MLALANGAARYEVEGEIAADFQTNRPGFSSEFDIDAATLAALRLSLLPVFEGRGPIMLTVGRMSREIPVAGMAKPLARFKAVCFARR
jgi:hypothetical protein